MQRREAPPIFIGVAAVAQERLGEDESGGVTVLAGFNPLAGPTEMVEYLYLRGL